MKQQAFLPSIKRILMADLSETTDVKLRGVPIRSQLRQHREKGTTAEIDSK
jgi:hypothetical protein